MPNTRNDQEAITIESKDITENKRSQPCAVAAFKCSILALIFSILPVVFFWLPFLGWPVVFTAGPLGVICALVLLPILTLLVGIISLILAVIAVSRREPRARRLAIRALILGILDTAVGLGLVWELTHSEPFSF